MAVVLLGPVGVSAQVAGQSFTAGTLLTHRHTATGGGTQLGGGLSNCRRLKLPSTTPARRTSSSLPSAKPVTARPLLVLVCARSSRRLLFTYI
jgi:hypothetical protein